jgi:hypothetical protein
VVALNFGGFGDGKSQELICDTCVLRCYHDPIYEIRIEAEGGNLKFFGALAAPVELLSCVWGAIFCIAPRFNTRGGDALKPETKIRWNRRT